MNELSKVVNAQLQQAAENLVRNRLMSDEFLDFVQENTKPLDTLMAYYKCAIMEVETKFKVLNEQFSLEYDRNPIESIKTRVKSLDGIVRKVRRKNIPLHKYINFIIFASFILNILFLLILLNL